MSFFAQEIWIICLFFRDENGTFLSRSRISRREREFFYSNLVFREGDEKLKIISQGRAGKNEADSHGNSREREFPSLSEAVSLHSFRLRWSQRVTNFSGELPLQWLLVLAHFSTYIYLKQFSPPFQSQKCAHCTDQDDFIKSSTSRGNCLFSDRCCWLPA